MEKSDLEKLKLLIYQAFKIIDYKNERIIAGEVVYITKKDAAKLISVSVKAIDLYISEGSLKVFYIRGKNVPRLKRSDVLNLLLEERITEARPQPKRRPKRGMSSGTN